MSRGTKHNAAWLRGLFATSSLAALMAAAAPHAASASTITVSMNTGPNPSSSTQAFQPTLSPTIVGPIINTGVVASEPTMVDFTSIGLFTGGIINSGSVTVSNLAIGLGKQVTSVAPVALPVFVPIFVAGTGGGLSGGLTNSGTISAIGTGVNPEVSTFTGGITNSGTITSGGIGISEIGGSIFSGGVTNSGTLAANKLGIGFIDVESFSGGITNSGAIAANQIAIGLNGIELFTGGISNSGTITGSGSGINVGNFGCNGAGSPGGVSEFAGSITNSGTIKEGTAGIVVVGITNFIGGIANSGTISASGMGIALSSIATFGTTSAGGGISNTGTISAGDVAIFVTNAGVINGGISNSGAISAGAAGIAVVGVDTLAGGITNSGTLAGGIDGIVVTGVSRFGTASTGGGIANSGVIAAASIGIYVGGVGSFAGTISNSGSITAKIGVVIDGVGFAGDALVNTGTITGTIAAIDAKFSGPNTIDQNAGLIQGAIFFSNAGDTLNINGGGIAGDLVGNGGTLATVNIQPGSGNRFTYANTMSGMGALNLNSGTMLLQNRALGGTGTIGATSFTQNAGTTLAFEVTPLTGAAATAGTGWITATSIVLNGTVEAIELPGAYGRANTTLTYNGLFNGAITGNFTTTSYSPLFAATLNPATGALTLTVLPASDVPGLTANQQALITALQNANLPPVDDALLSLNASQIGTVLTSLSGQQSTQNSQLVENSWQSFTNMLLDRLASGGGGGPVTAGSFTPGNGVQFAQAETPFASMSDGTSRSAAPAHWGAWARGYSLSADAPATASSSPYRESGAGVLFGADHQMTDRLVAGFAVTLATDKANIASGGQTVVDDYQGAVYANYAVDANWYINGIAGFSWQTYSSQRAIALGTVSIANGSYNGQGYRAYGETGYALHPAMLESAGLTLTPLVGLGYLHSHSDAYTENGSPFALAVQALDANSLTTTLGARATLAWHIGTTVFHPQIRAAWQHEWLDAATSVRASFAQAPGSVFSTTGTAFSRESFVGGAGIDTDISVSTQLFVDYDAKLNGGYISQVVSGGMRVAF